MALVWGRLNFGLTKVAATISTSPASRERMVADDRFNLPFDGDFFDGQVDAQGITIPRITRVARW
jgi:hypothetical protein